MAERVMVLVCKLESPFAMRFLSSLVKECEEREEKIMTRYTDNILRGEVVEHRGIKEKTRKNDRQMQFSQCVKKSPLIAKVAKNIGWSKLWDTGLSCGEKYTTGLQKLS